MSTNEALKILIVDDEEIVRHTVERFLDFLGHDSECAEDGLSGQRALEKGDYDAAIVDLRMPGLNGISLLVWAKEVRPDIKIIIISGHGTDDAVQKIMKAGAFAFLSKPFQLNEIKGLMEKIQKERVSNFE